MAHPANQIPSQSVILNAGQSVSFPARSITIEEEQITSVSNLTGEFSYAVYCLSDATVTITGSFIIDTGETSGTESIFQVSSSESIALSAGMTIYGKFKSISVAGTGAKILAYV